MINLKESDTMKVTVLMDNYTDALIPSTENAQRPPLADGSKVADPLWAEHGLSLFIEVFTGNQRHCILLDTGWSEEGILHNMKILKIANSDIEAIVLSHGHMDHFGGLEKILKLSPQKIPLILHPDVFLDSRFLQFPDGKKVNFPSLMKSSIKKAGAILTETFQPHLMVSDLAATTGEVARVTDFEKGFPGAYFERDGKIETDQVLDDLSILINLKKQGLVIISGCAHSGIVNTVLHARKITGVDKVCAVIGGFHLTGPFFEPIIEATIAELKKIDPKIIVPMHCTGFKATMGIAREIPDKFILSGVGLKIVL